jgi:hypothetical protein
MRGLILALCLSAAKAANLRASFLEEDGGMRYSRCNAAYIRCSSNADCASAAVGQTPCHTCEYTYYGNMCVYDEDAAAPNQLKKDFRPFKMHSVGAKAETPAVGTKAGSDPGVDEYYGYPETVGG